MTTVLVSILSTYIFVQEYSVQHIIRCLDFKAHKICRLLLPRGHSIVTNGGGGGGAGSIVCGWDFG